MYANVIVVLMKLFYFLFRCAVITSIPAGESKTFECRGMEGRYVNIVIPGRQESLTLCEVEVTGQPYGTQASNGDLQQM